MSEKTFESVPCGNHSYFADTGHACLPVGRDTVTLFSNEHESCDHSRVS